MKLEIIFMTYIDADTLTCEGGSGASNGGSGYGHGVIGGLVQVVIVLAVVAWIVVINYLDL
jgi:hypothetical protein